MRQSERPCYATKNVCRFVAQSRRLCRKKQPDGASGHHVEPAAARRQLGKNRARVAKKRDCTRIRIEKKARELRVFVSGCHPHEPLREYPFDVDPIAEACPARAYCLEHSNEHLGCKLFHDRPHAPESVGLVLLRRRPKPRVHIRDGLVVEPRGECGQRQFLLKDQTSQWIDRLSNERPQERDGGVGLPPQPEPSCPRHDPEVVRRSFGKRSGSDELRIRRREIVLAHALQSQRHTR